MGCLNSKSQETHKRLEEDDTDLGKINPVSNSNNKAEATNAGYATSPDDQSRDQYDDHNNNDNNPHGYDDQGVDYGNLSNQKSGSKFQNVPVMVPTHDDLEEPQDFPSRDRDYKNPFEENEQQWQKSNQSALTEVDYHSWLPSDDELVEDSKLGELNFQVQYVSESEELIVRVKRGRNLLRKGDSLCDSYVKVNLFPDPTKKYSFKSEVKRGTTEPLYDEQFLFPKITESDVDRKILKITVYDEASQNPYIGEINIRLNKIGLDLIVPRWVPLRREKVTQTTIAPSKSTALSGKDQDSLSVAPSMGSTASSSGGKAAVKNHDYGKVHLSMQYKASKQTLQVVVVAARLNKLPGTSNIPSPYVKLYLLPDPSKKSKQKTKAQKNTLDPSYNESFDYKVDKEAYESKRLQVTIWDHENLVKSVFLGETLIRLSTLPPNDTVNKWCDLESQSYGELYCKLVYEATTDYLNITIVKGRDLVPNRSGGSVDPYVKIYLIPDPKKQTKKKTHYRKQTLDPEYNETIQYFLAEVDNPRGRYLHISVLDHSSVGNSEMIGAFSLPLEEVMNAGKMENWYSLIRDKASMEGEELD